MRPREEVTLRLTGDRSKNSDGVTSSVLDLVLFQVSSKVSVALSVLPEEERSNSECLLENSREE